MPTIMVKSVSIMSRICLGFQPQEVCYGNHKTKLCRPPDSWVCHASHKIAPDRQSSWSKRGAENSMALGWSRSFVKQWWGYLISTSRQRFSSITHCMDFPREVSLGTPAWKTIFSNSLWLWGSRFCKKYS